MTGLDQIRDAARELGLGVVGAFHPGPEDKAPDGIRTLLLLGPDGSDMWQVFSTSPEHLDGAAHAMERWSERVIGDLAQHFSAQAFFPFGGPPWHAFQHWAACGEGAQPSPVGMQASPSRGLWASYRGALGFAERLDIPFAPGASPCLDCPAPCQTACPVDAFSSGAYDVPRCTAHLRTSEGAACLDGCLVRRACPAGQQLNLPTEQRRFHMAAFLDANG